MTEISPINTSPKTSHIEAIYTNINKELVRLLSVFQKTLFGVEQIEQDMQFKAAQSLKEANESKHSWMHLSAFSHLSGFSALAPIGDVLQKAFPKLIEGGGALAQAASSQANVLGEGYQTLERQAMQSIQDARKVLEQLTQSVHRLIQQN